MQISTLQQTASPLAQKNAAHPRLSDDFRQLFIIDSNVPDYQQIVATLPPGAEVHILDPLADGLGQISEILHKVDRGISLHLISHGAPGILYLGNGTLELHNLETYTSQLEQWGITDLYIYGCNVAAGDAGAEFIEKLQQITGATIYANAHPTGNPELGGTWELRTIQNQAQLDCPLNKEILAAYPHLLGPTMVKNRPLAKLKTKTWYNE
ncbi:MAG: hypothetical protein RLZZ338_2867 [Cyanobacteriota bacterium]|jgi:hypothetical protein